MDCTFKMQFFIYFLENAFVWKFLFEFLLVFIAAQLEQAAAGGATG